MKKRNLLSVLFRIFCFTKAHLILSSMNRGKKLFGVVISPTARPGSERTNQVFVLENTGLTHVFYVLKEAFTLVPDAIERVEGANEFDIIADIKNQVRKREKALDVGDWISWFYSGTDEITDFRREQKLHEVRCGNPNYQFLLDCVKSPTEAVLYNKTFGFVDISPEENRKLLPDIAFTAWVEIYLGKKDNLVVKFHSYVTSNHTMQINLLDTPWVEHHKVDQRGFTEEDEEEYLIEKSVADKARENNVYGVFGYYVSERSLYVEETPEKFFLLPYVDESLLVPGVKYRFNAYWNEKMNVFIVAQHGLEMMEDMDVLHTEHSAVQHRDKILMLEGVNQRLDYKSLFFTTKSGYGTMDDPTGALITHHLSRYAESKCRVYFYEDRNASFGRFRIEKVEVDKAKKIEKNVRDGVTEVKGVKGVVISDDGRVFSPTHSPLRCNLPIGENLAIGTHVAFTAVFNHKTHELEATRSSLKVFRDQEPLEYVEHKGRVIFKTSGTWTARSDVITGIVSPHFSLVDDPLKVLPRAYSRGTDQVNLWVAESGTDESGFRRIAQTPFFVVSASNKKPSEPTFVDKAGRDIAGWIRTRDGTLQGMEIITDKKSAVSKYSQPSRDPFSVSCPSPSPFLSLDASFDCGCNDGSCVARRLLVDLMNIQDFRTLLHSAVPPKVFDQVLDCIL